MLKTLSAATAISYLAACFVFVALANNLPVHADDLCSQTKSPAECALAQRFRPYLKFNSDGLKDDEPFHPINWQNVLRQSQLLRHNARGDTVLVAAADTGPGDWSADFSELLTKGGDIRAGHGADFSVSLGVPEGAHAGDPWADVIHRGNGIYAHVQHVVDDERKEPSLINIEYTILYAFNQPPGGVGQLVHSGDITSIVVLYDPDADEILRVSFSEHGCIIHVYQLQAEQSLSEQVQKGLDESFATKYDIAARIDVDSKNAADNNSCATKSDPHIYFAADPGTHLYEHPEIYVEVGGHEPWPNATGFLAAAGNHNGDGISFLPDEVQYLGSIPDQIEVTQEKFVFYSGLFGEDPHAIALHTTWCWPPMCRQIDNPYGISPGDFDDRNPYEQIDALPWPSHRYVRGSADIYISVTSTSNKSGIGTQAAPIAGLDLGYSFAAVDSTLHLKAGSYPGAIVLGRRMKLVSEGGVAVIGTYEKP